MSTSRNRRHAHMARALDGDGYFASRAMRRRAPGLFDTMVGVYARREDDDEVHHDDDDVDDDVGERATVSGAILAREDAREFREIVTRAREAEGLVMHARGVDEGGRETFGAAFGGGRAFGASLRSVASSDGRVSEEAWRRAMFEGWDVDTRDGGSNDDAPHASASPKRVDEDAEAEETRERSTFVLDIDDYRASEGTSTAYLSQHEYAQRMADFERVMRERFLAGEDEGFDYARVDADASLDDHWAKEIERDAEDRYFDEED